MTSTRNLTAFPALLAALSLTATPAAAADLPLPAVKSAADVATAWEPSDDTSDYHRRYRYRRGVSAGDVLAGVLIIGGIAAIANSAKRSEDRRYRDREYRYPDNRYPDRRDDYRQDYDARGIDRAVEMCANEVERNARIDSVDTVNRTGQGWQVTGSLYNGEGFTCSIGQDGRIEAIDYGRGGAAYQGGYEDSQAGDDRDYSAQAPQDDRQYDEDYYAAARARADGQDGAQPAYPGGPVDGDADQPDIEYGTGYQGVGEGA